jgi:hypothetical protein
MVVGCLVGKCCRKIEECDDPRRNNYLRSAAREQIRCHKSSRCQDGLPCLLVGTSWSLVP